MIAAEINKYFYFNLSNKIYLKVLYYQPIFFES